MLKHNTDHDVCFWKAKRIGVSHKHRRVTSQTDGQPVRAAELRHTRLCCTWSQSDTSTPLEARKNPFSWIFCLCSCTVCSVLIFEPQRGRANCTLSAKRSRVCVCVRGFNSVLSHRSSSIARALSLLGFTSCSSSRPRTILRSSISTHVLILDEHAVSSYATQLATTTFLPIVVRHRPLNKATSRLPRTPPARVRWHQHSFSNSINIPEPVQPSPSSVHICLNASTTFANLSTHSSILHRAGSSDCSTPSSICVP